MLFFVFERLRSSSSKIYKKEALQKHNYRSLYSRCYCRRQGISFNLYFMLNMHTLFFEVNLAYLKIPSGIPSGKYLKLKEDIYIGSYLMSNIKIKLGLNIGQLGTQLKQHLRSLTVNVPVNYLKCAKVT